MTKAQFITAITQEPTFIKWAQEPAVIETIGEIEKYAGMVYRTTHDGANVESVVFIVDKATDTATWQVGNTLSPVKNTFENRVDKLVKYLSNKANFFAYRIIFVDPENYWACAEVYKESGTDLAKSIVLVYKDGSSPIAHKNIV